MARTALIGAAVAAVAISLGAIAPAAASVPLFSVMVWWSVPGLVLAKRLYGSRTRNAVAAWLIGPAWGYVLSSLVLLGLWAAGVRRPSILLMSPLPAIACVWPAHRLANLLTPPALTRRDAAPVAILCLALVAIVARPYSRVGVDLPDGRAYRAYFTADFVWEMTVAAEVSKGDVPPQNPFYLNDVLHYYWLMHLLPGAEHRAAGSSVRLDDILLINAFAIGLAFVAFLYWFVRHFVESPWAAAIACLFVLFCSSFEGADRLWVLWQRGLPFETLRSINIDAVGNWFYQGMKIDGLHRAILYQPQHQLGYILGLSALLILLESREPWRAPLTFVAGSFLGLSALLSTVAAAIVGGAVAAYELYRIVQARRWIAIVPAALAGLLPVGLVLALIHALQYVDSVSGGNPIVRIGLNRLAAHRIAWTVFLNFGPVLPVAAAGLVMALRRQAGAAFVSIACLVAMCAVCYFYVDIPEHDSVYVAWRASHLVFIGFAALVGYAVQEFWRSGGTGRLAFGILTVAGGVIALPTVLIDLYNTQDVANRGMGPGFQWTVVLNPSELEALDWIRRVTPIGARVQIEPFVRQRDAYYVTAFGERRMAGGLPTGLVPLAKYQAVSQRIRDVYRAGRADSAHALAAALCIDYLIVGPPERAAYPQFQATLDSDPLNFPPAFRNDAMAIYAVSGLTPPGWCAP
jgi:hypothetical protein